LHSIFLSPKQNIGQDVANHFQIDFDYGTTDDLLELIEELHSNNIKLILDLPINQTSYLHPWFETSKDDKTNPKRNWYIWKNGNKNKKPNNWKSLLKEDCWQYNVATDDYYYYSTYPFQPDLNFENEEVQNYMLEVLDYWLKLGVDGFKFSLGFNLFKDFKHDENPFSWNLLNLNGKLPFSINSASKAGKNPFYEKVEQLLLKYKDKLLIEDKAGNIDQICLNVNQANIHHNIYNEFSKLKFSAANYAALIKKIEKNYKENQVPAYMASSIHLERMFSRTGEVDDIASLIASLQFTLRGVAYIYYGEEIGLKNIQPKNSICKDPALQLKKFKNIGNKSFRSRDASWLPMLWNYTNHGGFSPIAAATPWLPIHANYRQENVEAHHINKRSIYHIYKKLFHLKGEEVVLQKGNMNLVNEELLAKNILCFTRNYNGQTITALANFNKTKASTNIEVKHNNFIFSNVPGVNNFRSDQSTLELLPFQLNLYKEKF